MPTSRCTRGAHRARHQGGDQEPQLLQVRAQGLELRDRPPDRRPRGAARSPRRRACGTRTATSPRHAQQGERLRLPLLPRAGPGAGGARPGLGRGAAGRAARAARGPAPPLGARPRHQLRGRRGALRAAGAGRLLRGVAGRVDPKAAANWVRGELRAQLRELGQEPWESGSRRPTSPS